jgi:hypothetical protein
MGGAEEKEEREEGGEMGTVMGAKIRWVLVTETVNVRG